MVTEEVGIESGAGDPKSADLEAAEEIAVGAQESEASAVVGEVETAGVVEAPAEPSEAVETETEAVEMQAGRESEKSEASAGVGEVETAEVVEASAEPSEAVEMETEAGEVEAGEESEKAEIEIPQDGRAWYVIHCYSGYEAKVKHNLEQRIETMQMQDQIFQVVVPTEDEIEVRDGKRRVIERRVFPGYILVQMLLSDDSWYVVRNTPGVTGFVGMGNEPTPLRSEEVQSIMKRMEAEAPKIKVTFKHGQKVRIVDGPFNEFIGVVDEIDMERAKVRVLVSFFGRETPVELDFLQVEKT
jgi:transcriptional antiterminator NusG